VGVKVVAKPPYMAARKCDFKIGEGIVSGEQKLLTVFGWLAFLS
jgi:hypothetical protein